MLIQGLDISVSGSWLKTAYLTEDWYEDVDEPGSLIAAIVKSGLKADVFTFWQRLPHTEPRYSYAMHWDTIAVLPITTYAAWVKSQINDKTRNMIVKARKKGIVVERAAF